MAECHILTIVSTWAACWESSVSDASWKNFFKNAMCFPTYQLVQEREKMSQRKNEMTFENLNNDSHWWEHECSQNKSNIPFSLGRNFRTHPCSWPWSIHSVLVTGFSPCGQISQTRKSQKAEWGKPPPQCLLTHMSTHTHIHTKEPARKQWEQRVHWFWRLRKLYTNHGYTTLYYVNMWKIT